MIDAPLRQHLGRIQQQLQVFYQLEAAPHVADFVQAASDESREQVMVRQNGDHVELAVVLPKAAWNLAPNTPLDDAFLQVVEGVSHFLYIAERARTELPTTRLELELQAEVDKFVVLGLATDEVDARRARALHKSLYAAPRYLHGAHTEDGQRYRLANGLAARLFAGPLRQKTHPETRRWLRRFYRAGQAEKIRYALSGAHSP